MGVKEPAWTHTCSQPSILWFFHLSSCTQGLSCHIFKYVEHHWRGRSF